MSVEITPDYDKQILDLTDWFKARLPSLGSFALTRAQYTAGIDSLTGLHKQLADSAFIEWLTMRQYELSYNQSCIAFFDAAISLKAVVVTD